MSRLGEKAKRLDLGITGLIMLLTGYGLITLWGSVSEISGLRHFFYRQLLWAGIGFAVFFLVFFIGCRTIRHWAAVIYIFNLLLLVLVLWWGTRIRGAQSWLRMGPVGLQPSELMKISLVLMLASWWGEVPRLPRGLLSLVVPVLLTLVPTALVLKQPDMGTALSYPLILLIMLVLAGIKWRYLVATLLVAVAVGVVGYPHLKPYQKQRLQVYLNPWQDTRDKGYNIVQAEITLGSGRLSGKGWGKGTQTAMRFLPEHYTDFIFNSLGEQFGLVGVAVLFLLYGALIARCVHTLMGLRELGAKLCGGGLLGVFCLHIVINVGMATGLLPVIGLSLPFFSYGGSFLLSNFILFGLLADRGGRGLIF